MEVAILEEVNNHADAGFKRLKDIGGGHTIYQNGTERLGMKHMARKTKIEKSEPTGGHYVGSVGPPETGIFFFWP